VIIPTFHRPAGLQAALKSVFDQINLPPGRYEIVVVDNGFEGKVKDSLDPLSFESVQWTLRIIHEPLPGVASARNAGVCAAKGPLIVFLDDDEVAEPEWLAHMLAVHNNTGADVVFGRVRGILQEGSEAHPRLVEDFFSRETGRASGLIDDFFGTGNSLISRRAFSLADSGFDLARGHTGGEDDVFFSHLQAAGARFAWCQEGLVYEMIPAHRATRSYMRLRGFMIGQGPPLIALSRRPPDYLGLIGWMGVGLAQIVIYGAQSLWFRVKGDAYRADKTENRAMQGLGKFFWMDYFRPRHYGIVAALLPLS
jgi:hypothetical protein